MELWNTNKTIDAIKRGDLNEWEKAKYYIGLLVFQLLVLAIYSAINANSNGIEASINYMLSTIVGGTGAILCFNVNKKIDNINFIERLVMLSLPINIKVTLFFWVLILVLFSGALDVSLATPLRSFLSIASGPIYYSIIFYLLRSSFEKIHA